MSKFNVAQVRKGFTLVKLRSQESIERGQSLEEAIMEEERFFAEHPHYKWVPLSFESIS